MKCADCRLHPIALDGFAVETLTLYFSTSPGDAATAATPIEGSGIGSGHVERAPVSVPLCRKMIEAVSYSACGVGSRVIMVIHDSVIFCPCFAQGLSTRKNNKNFQPYCGDSSQPSSTFTPRKQKQTNPTSECIFVPFLF